MNNVSHKKSCNSGVRQPRLKSPPIPLIKNNHNHKSDKDLVKIKLCRYPTSSSSDLYKFKMDMFDNGEPEEFLLFLQNFNITLAVSGTLATDKNIQYICTLVCVKLLCRFDLLSADVEVAHPINVEASILGLAP